MTRELPTDQADRLKALLKPIAEMFMASRITIVVRTPEGANSAGSLVLGNDNPTEALKVLRAHMVSEAERFAAEGAASGQPGAEWPKHKNLDEI